MSDLLREEMDAHRVAMQEAQAAALSHRPTAMPAHPHGVQPEGTLLLSGASAAAAAAATRRAGLGRFGLLSDATLLQICGFCAPEALLALCATSDVFAAYASSEELWRTACAQRVGGEPVKFCGTWKRTFRAVGGRVAAPTPRAATRGVSVYSDALFLSHQLTHGPNHFGAAPRGPPIARISRDAAVDVRAFAAEYEAGAGTPAIIESAAGSTIGASSGAWDEAALRQTLGDRIFHAGGVNFRLSDYFDYAATNDDDQPLYLFDPTFGASAPELLREYEPPPHFRDELFALLDGADRPDYRWLLIGGARSGQSWHKDPNMSSAWNLTLRGRKRWLFFPPHVTPPGVFPTSTDGGHDYATPIALAEWARDHYAEACRTPGFVEAETGPGDVTFVPRGWWHMVLNVAPLTVAVSHHFVSPAGLYTTLRLLRTTPHQVSGVDRGLTRDRGDDAGAMTAEEREAADHARRTAAGVALHDRLVAALREKRPEVLEAAEATLAAEAARRAPSALKRAVAPEEAAPSFAFGFG